MTCQSLLNAILSTVLVRYCPMAHGNIIQRVTIFELRPVVLYVNLIYLMIVIVKYKSVL